LSTQDKVRQIRADAGSAITDLGLLVEDVSVTPAGKRRIVRILVDRNLSDLDASDTTSQVGALSLDDVADATRAISSLLDDSEVMGATPYVLEVSSPGVGRPLTHPRHFRRNVTRLVELSRLDGSRLTGRLVEAGAEGLTLAVPASKDQPDSQEHIPYADVARAEVQVEFARGTHEEDD